MIFNLISSWPSDFLLFVAFDRNHAENSETIAVKATTYNKFPARNIDDAAHIKVTKCSKFSYFK